MIQVKVRTLWEGKVGVPEKRVQEGKAAREPLNICYGDGVMLVPWHELEARVVGYSDWFHDRFGRGKYRLVYFLWKPTRQQETLL